MTIRCPHCGGSGLAPKRVIDLDVEVRATAMAASCDASSRTVFGGGRVDEKTAAWLVGRKPNTLRNWRMAHQPIPFEKHGGRVSYRLTDLARWQVETASTGEI